MQDLNQKGSKCLKKEVKHVPKFDRQSKKLVKSNIKQTLYSCNCIHYIQFKQTIIINFVNFYTVQSTKKRKQQND